MTGKAEPIGTSVRDEDKPDREGTPHAAWPAVRNGDWCRALPGRVQRRRREQCAERPAGANTDVDGHQPGGRCHASPASPGVTRLDDTEAQCIDIYAHACGDALPGRDNAIAGPPAFANPIPLAVSPPLAQPDRGLRRCHRDDDNDPGTVR